MEDALYYKAKKAEVMEAITPICEAFGIKDFDYIIDDKQERLRLNDTYIGCALNSVSAVVNELIGYIIVKIYCRNGYLGTFETQTLNYIKRYWINS